MLSWFYDWEKRFVGIWTKEERTSSHFWRGVKSPSAMERENFHSFLGTAWSSVALVLLHCTRHEWSLQEGWQSCWVALSLLCNSAFPKHGHGPALLAWQCCEGQSMLRWEEASFLLHWLIEIPGKVLRVYLKIDESKQINQTAKRKWCSIRVQRSESWARPAARGSGRLGSVSTQAGCGAGHSCHWTSHRSSDSCSVLVFAVSSGREATWACCTWCSANASSAVTIHLKKKKKHTQKALFLFTVFLLAKPLSLWCFQKEAENLPVWCCSVSQVLVLCFRVCAHPERAALLCVRATSMSLAVSVLSGWEDLCFTSEM